MSAPNGTPNIGKRVYIQSKPTLVNGVRTLSPDTASVMSGTSLPDIYSDPKRTLGSSDTSKRLTRTFALASPNRKSAMTAIYPEQGIFENIALNVTYSKLFTVRNTSASMTNIRIIPPAQSDNYTLIFVPPKKGLAPGLEVSFKILFTTKVSQDCHDKVIVATDTEMLDVPLHAYLPTPDIVIANIFNLGTIAPNQSETKYFELKNVGTKEGTFKFFYDEQYPIYIAPITGMINARGVQRIKVVFKGSTTSGELRYPVRVELGDVAKNLEIYTKVVERRVEFVQATGGGLITRLIFMPLYYGQKTTMKAFLVNTSPFATNFLFSKAKSEDTFNADEREDFDLDLDSDGTPFHFKITPSDGVIQGYSQTPITITFCPKQPRQKTGFKSAVDTKPVFKFDCNQDMIVEISDTEQKIPFQLSGIALKMNVELSQNEFRFVNCAVNERQDSIFTINNLNDNAIDFAFDKVAHFQISPQTGVIKGHESQNVIITFHPNQLGVFKNKLLLTISGGIKKIPILVYGQADTTANKTRTMGGIDKVPEDFMPSKNFVQTKKNSEVGNLELTLTSRPKEKTEKYTVYESSNVPMDKLKEFQEKRANQDLYNSYIKNTREGRVERLNFKQEGLLVNNFMNDVDLGMEPGSGMESPKPSLKWAEEAVYIADRSDNQGVSDSVVRKPKKFDENKLVKKKFKAYPTTANEIRDSKIKLNARMLSKIITGPKMLDFGQMTVFGKATKSFGITNELKQYLYIQAANQTNDVKISPESQVVPPLATAGFDVTFCSESIQVVQNTMYLTINEHNKIKFVVMGDVIPTEVDVSAEELRFRFSEFSLEQSVTDTIALKNKGNSTAFFSWHNNAIQASTPTPTTPIIESEDPNEGEDVVQASPPPRPPQIFSIYPESGEIPPEDIVIVEFTFTPGDVNQIEEEFILDIRGSTSTKKLKCIGSMNEAKVTSVEKKIDYGAIPVGQRRARQITLKNIGESAAVFNVEPLPDFKITPAKGRIVSGSNQKLQLELKPTTSSTIDTDLIINIRGGKKVRVAIKGEAKIPMVEMEGGFLNFGEVFVGSIARRPVTLRNVGGTIPAVLYLDFSLYSDFHVANEKGVLITDNSDSEEPIVIEAPDLSDNEDSDDDANEDDGYGSERDDSNQARRYKFTVEPNSSLSFFIVLKPRRVQEYKFTLQLSLAGIPPSMTGFNREVRAKALKPRLVTSHHVVDFGRKVIIGENTGLMPHRFILNFTNEDANDIFWDHGEFELNSIFRMEPAFGHLNPGQSSQIQLLFTPHESKEYSTTLPIYLDHQYDKSYFDIQISGIGSAPSLSFDQKEIIFPVVPLNIVATQVFTIINEGYEKLDLKYKLPPDTARVPLKLRFIEGSELTIEKPTVVAEISFVSPKPTSFTAVIDFFDNEGTKYSIPVSCTADNCLFTNYPFIINNKDGYRIEDGKSIMLVQRDSNRDATDDDVMSSRFSSYSNHTATTGTSSVMSMHELIIRRAYSKRSCDRILNWLNVNVLTNPVDDLMKTIYFSSGGFIFDIIAALSGKKPSGRLTKIPQNKLEACKAIYKQYDDLLKFLKSYGALLNNIRPEYMMTYEEYQKIFNINAKGTIGNPSFRRMTEKRFRYKSMEAWLTVLYQVIKLFVLARITIKHVKTMPGIPSDQFSNPDSFASSNIYNVSECVLLRWMSYHVNKEYPPGNDTSIRVVNFGADLRSGLVFAALVKAHIPHVASKFESLRMEPQELLDFEHNAGLVIAAINEARLDYVISVRDLVQANPRDMLLFCLYLYNTLPEYVPKTTIEFKGNLNELITKHIELTNPTKYTIEYNVTIEGSKEFTVPEDKIVLKPKAKMNVPIEICPRFCAPTDARLTFHANRSGSFNPTTLVFLLQTSVATEKYQKTIDVSTMIYEPRKIEIEVENPFDKHAQFSILLKQRIKDAVEMPTNNLPDGFWCPIDFVALKKNEKKRILIQYLPFIGRCTYECKILFSDRRVGEFIYCINAESRLPDPMNQVEVRAECNSTSVQDIPINSTNSAVERAVNTLKERYKKFRIGRSILPIPELEQVTFKVEYSSPFFTGPESITISKKNHEPLALKVNFSPKVAGVYPCNVILLSDYDFRLYTIEGKAISPGIRAELEFSVPVRQKITQDIPIVNKSDKFWRVQAVLTGECFYGPNEIRVPPTSTMNYPLIFYPKTMCKVTGELELSNPDTLEKYIYTLRGKADEPLAEEKIQINCNARDCIEQQLAVPNISPTKQAISYKVEIELPFVSGAAGHDVPAPKRMASASARSRHSQHYESDSVSIAASTFRRGDKEPSIVEIPPKTMYKLTIKPPIGGFYSGTVTFSTPDGEQVWYVLEVNASRAPCEDHLKLKCVVREQILTQVPISNPADKPISFVINMQGHGLTSDQATISLGPKEKKMFDLRFEPLQIGNHTGVLSFYNEDVGEFWYELELQAVQPPPIELPELTCSIGKTAGTDIFIHNPASEAMRMNVEIDNTQNFSLQPSPLILQPNENCRITIQYYPSSVDKKEKGQVKITNPTIGEWVYLVSGRGQKPSEMDPKRVYAQLNKTQSSILTFKNPFPVTKRVSVSLATLDAAALADVSKQPTSTLALATANSQKQAFKLVMTSKDRTTSLTPFGTVQIPFTFTPQQMNEYRATVVVEVVGEDISWRYPIIGIAEAVTTESFEFKCPARTSVEKIIQVSIPLSNVPASDDETLSVHSAKQLPSIAELSDAKYTFEVTYPEDQSMLKALKRAITVAELKSGEIQSPEVESDVEAKHLYFKVTFSPLRPMGGAAQLMIRKEGGGIFRYELLMEATAPEVDDIIEIQSQINTTESVSFRLTNIFARSVPFEAYFTSDSPSDFVVHPSRGQLAAYGYEGTQFVVSYTAKHYGRPAVGILVVDTEEMQWRYELRGVLPKYVAPKAKGKVQTRLREQTPGTPKKKNFLKQNMKNL